MHKPLVTSFLLASLASLASVGGGCGPASQRPAPDGPDQPIGGDAPAPPIADTRSDAEKVCDAIAALQQGGCPWVGDFPQGAACVDDVERSQGDPLAVAAMDCFIREQGCGAVEACIQQVIANASGGGGGPKSDIGYRECGDTESFGAVALPQAEYDRRHGASARTFADAPTSKDQPIEVCMAEQQLAWLTSVTCADGSNPFRDYGEAHAARTGNVGAGGRCGSIIDLYEVPCPEQTYQVYMDMYVCPEPF